MRKKHLSHRIYILLVASVCFVTVSCDQYFRNSTQDQPIARLGDVYMYRKDIPKFLYENRSAVDSAAVVNDYINKWASKLLMIDKATLNLPDQRIQEFERLTANYRADLYTLAYKEALVNESKDTTITTSQLNAFYETEKENFKLREKIVQLRFVLVSNEFLQRTQLKDKLIQFRDTDKHYLDSISIYTKKMNLNDTLWVERTRVLNEIGPLSNANEHLYLKKSQFFEIQDSLGVYLGFVKDVKEINEIAPLSYIEMDIKTVLLNRRKQSFLRNLESDIIDEAIKKNEFELYD